MKKFEFNATRLEDAAADLISNRAAEEAELESHIDALRERLAELGDDATDQERAAIDLEICRALVDLRRGDEAWPLGRPAIDVFVRGEQWDQAADACEILFRAEQPGSLSALGQGIWLAVTYPSVDPGLAVELLEHVIEETPDDSDGAAVAATVALFLSDIRAKEKERERLMFFAGQLLGAVARRHSDVETQDAFDLWMERLELNHPDKFLPRLRNVVDVLVQDDWWFDRDALQARLPVN